MRFYGARAELPAASSQVAIAVQLPMRDLADEVDQHHTGARAANAGSRSKARADFELIVTARRIRPDEKCDQPKNDGGGVEHPPDAHRAGKRAIAPHLR